MDIARELEGIVSYSMRKVIQHKEAALSLDIEAPTEMHAKLIYITKLKLLNLGDLVSLNCLADMGLSEIETEIVLEELEEFISNLTPDKYLH